MGKNIQIDDIDLYRKISDYCKINDLKISKFITEMLRKQFMIEQYGDIPFGDFIKKDKPTEIQLTTKIIETEVTKPTINPLNPYETTISEKKSYIDTTMDNVEKNTEETKAQTLKPKKRRL